MDVEIWSDVMCPWCYIGKRRFEAATRDLSYRDQLVTIWRSYRLRPDQPQTPGMTLGEMMTRRFNMPPAAVVKRFAYIRSMGQEVGIEINLDSIRPVSSFDAHRLLHMAGRHGLRDHLLESLFRAYLSDNENIADPAVLERIAGDVGLDRAETQSVLSSDAFGADVLADERRAQRLGVSSVPTFVISGKHALPGFQSSEEAKEVLNRAWFEGGHDQSNGATRPAPDTSCAI